MKFLNEKYYDLEKLAKENNYKYTEAKPFPHIVIDNLFNENYLNEILNDFPSNIDEIGDKFNNKVEKKITLNNTNKFSELTNDFINFLNSIKFIVFLQKLTNVNEKLIPDPYLVGGGLHELRNEGYLNIHADFNLHPLMKLDRRLNILIYLNRNWESSYGGSLELWGKNMKKCEKKIIPTFNKTVIFSTNDYSYHGNPEKINHPNKISRKSIAMYYYSNGRPNNEKILGNHSSIFRKRPNTNEGDSNVEYKKIFGKIYIKRKNKIK